MLSRQVPILSGSVQPALDLNFIAGLYDSRLTQSVRSSNATMWDSQGRLVWAPANMQPRSYDLTLISGGTSVNSDVIGLDGIFLKQFTANGAASGHYFYSASSVTVVVGSKYTASAVISSSSNDLVQLSCGSVITSTGAANFNLSTLATQTVGASVSNPKITQLSGGLYRISADFDCVGSGGSGVGTLLVAINAISDGRAPVFSTSNVIVGGCVQLEPTGVDSPKDFKSNTTGSAYYGPRMDYEPSTGAFLGLLVEDAKTNLCIYSQNFSGTNWTLTDTTPTTGQSSPDGFTNATLLTEGSAGTAVAMHTTMTIVANRYVMHSRFIKKGNNDWVCLQVDDGTNGMRAWFNLNTGVVGSKAAVGTGTSTIHGMRDVGGGWYHCWMAGRLDAASTAYTARSFCTSNDNVTTRVNNATRYEFQVDAWYSGSGITPDLMSTPVPTYGATVTRAIDTPYMLAASWYANGPLTTYCEYSYPYARLAASGRSSHYFDLSDNTVNNRISFVNGGANIAQIKNVTGGTTTFAPTSSAVAAIGEIKKTAFAAAANDVVLADSVDVTIRANTTYIPTFSLYTHLYIGTSPSGGVCCCGHIRRLKIWNGRKSNTQLLQMVQ